MNLTTTAAAAAMVARDHDLTATQIETIYVLRVIACVLNLLGTLLIVSSIVLYRRYRIFESRLILFLSICAGLSTFAWLVPDVNEVEQPSLCAFQAVWQQFFDWSVIMWILVFAVNAFLVFVKNVQTAKFEFAYNALVWGVSSLFTVIPLFDPSSGYGDAGSFCWIRTNAMRFGAFYIELFVIFLVVLVLYILVFKAVRDQARVAKAIGSAKGETETDVSRRMRTESKIKAYVAVFIVMWLPAIINRVHQLFADRPEFWLVLLHSVSVPLQGAVNSIIYASTEDGTMRMLRNPREAFKLAKETAAGRAAPAAAGVQEYSITASDKEMADGAQQRDNDGFDKLSLN
jgi:hypothetical protein